MLQSIQEPKYRAFGDIDWPDVSTKPGVAHAEEVFLLVQNSAVAQDQRSDAALIVKRLNQLMINIRERDQEIKGWTSLIYSLMPVQLSGVGRITAGGKLQERKDRARLDTAVVLLAYSEETPQWLRESARSIRDFADIQIEDDDEGASLSVDRAVSGLRLLSKLSAVFQSRPFVYPSAGDSLTIELITKKGRLTIIHDARGNQLIQTTPAGVSSATYSSDDADFNAIRDTMQDFYSA